jgi:hypothetical protein
MEVCMDAAPPVSRIKVLDSDDTDCRFVHGCFNDGDVEVNEFGVSAWDQSVFGFNNSKIIMVREKREDEVGLTISMTVPILKFKPYTVQGAG